MKWIVFIAKTKKNRLFTGIATKPYLKKYNVIYQEEYASEKDAKIRLVVLKKMSRNFKVEVVKRKVLHA
ncbi:hypothetical protein A2773_00780 [Candidatus Gottesmanbacteria bacterium RIFCSPHIGHO2_01_FULL_39_10]|uniref:GIY-YIG domain-containing protein n=1 Tax=Candidatus Gottesmanbacteria bacterium RIFCSPHIGHO2_01_FULL_39_10 TaxID=1798375 RepID=A0A1F5ZLI8_9BACT|nr:MAG: hypothetical protein A2773_00780 [Candidatus Gottesmanbacteria bacterium RIFCSPHIGHO2_01_FULL_39_10]